MSDACWQVLGIAPTADERAIKRAYAQLLKQCRPEDDPEGFQRLREALEQAQVQAWQSQEQLASSESDDAPVLETAHTSPIGQVCPDCGKVHTAYGPAEDIPESDRAHIDVLKPWVDELARLNSDNRVDEAIVLLQARRADPFCQTPRVAELFEDGILFLCCDDRHVHDYFVRAACESYGWLSDGNWLLEKEPRTVDWLRVRLQESDALDAVEKLLKTIENQDENGALQQLDDILAGDLLFNVDIKGLFEGELMVGLSQFQPLPVHFSLKVFQVFAWDDDHRHLQAFHPQAWFELSQKMLTIRLRARSLFNAF